MRLDDQTLKDINRAFKALEERDELLDKIRAEILAYDYSIGHNAQVRWCLSIIDKYREEQNYDKRRNS